MAQTRKVGGDVFRSILSSWREIVMQGRQGGWQGEYSLVKLETFANNPNVNKRKDSVPRVTP